MTLTNRQVRQLKALAHHLKPVVIIGNRGPVQQVLEEVDAALAHHELIKIRLPAISKADKQAVVDKVCAQCHCQSVGLTGRVAILFRQNPDRKNPIKLEGPVRAAPPERQ